jgi:uncharacterized protein (DUF2267 family)
MSVRNLEVFERTLETTHSWLNILMEILETPDKRTAYKALRATLHALRDRLTVEEAAHLSAQLPMLVRGFYYEGYNPTGKPVKERHRDQFLARIAEELNDTDEIDAEQAARAVFQLIEMKISSGEIQDVEHILPLEIRELWPTPRLA